MEIQVKKDTVGLSALPYTKEELQELMSKDMFSKYQIPIDYANSQFESNEQFLNYLSNCGILFPVLKNYELDDKLEDLLIRYIRFDRIYNIDALTSIWIAILFKEGIAYVDPKLETFIDSFRNKYGELIDEINDFLYALNCLTMNLIAPEDTELEELIKNGENARCKFVDVNILSLTHGILFCKYMAYNKRPKLKIYDELVNPTIEGETLVSKFLNIQPNYQLMLIRTLIRTKPEFREKMQDFVNSLPEKDQIMLKDLHDKLVTQREESSEK